MLTVLAPVKLNLTLEVLAKRPDGFHEIRSIIQTKIYVARLKFLEQWKENQRKRCVANEPECTGRADA